MTVRPGRFTANYQGDFVVFLIGMRINKLHRVTEWWPVMRAAGAMVAEALALPDTPLLESRATVCTGDPRSHQFIQYWRSFEELESWANDADLRHKPAQGEFFRRTAYNGNVGIWHEAFRVADGGFEAIYANTPRFGLAAAGSFRPLRPTSRARDRMGDGGSS
jgi:hypothetical protein